VNLSALQHQFRHWLTSEDATVAASFGGAAAPGLSVYLNNYRSQLMATLTDSYPVVRAWLGESAFLSSAARHVDAVHPDGWTLDDYARRFPDSLAFDNPNDPDVGELARLELELGLAFVAADGTKADPASLEHVDWTQAVFLIAPTLTLVPVTTNAVAILSAILNETTPPAAMSLPQAAQVAVWRRDFRPLFRTLEPLEADALAMAMRGCPFGDICDVIAHQAGEAEGPAVAGRILAQWLRDEMVLGVRPSGHQT
jgi:hypothetical protein